LLPLEAATASFVSHGVGTIRSSWRSSEKSTGTATPIRIEFNVSVPLNSVATIFVPASNVSEVKEGGMAATGATGVRLLRVQPASSGGDGTRPQLAVYELASGTFRFGSYYHDDDK
jgi:hypothetical protein